MPDLLASPDELAVLLEDEPIGADQAALFLKIASGEVRAYTGNLFDLVEDDVVILNGTGTRVLLLPEAPVSDVGEVLEAVGRTNALALGGPLTTSPSWEWDDDGVIERIDGGVFTRRRRFYQVTYSHGFEVVPDEVKGIVLSLASRSLLNPEGVRQETLGRYSYTLAGAAAGVGLHETELRTLDAYFVSTKMREGTPVVVEP